MTAWTREAVEALGPTTNVPTTARVIGVDPETVYASIRRGDWTATRVLKIGRAIKIPTVDLIRLLFAPDEVSAPPIPAVPSPSRHGLNALVTAHEPQCECGSTPQVSGTIHALKGA